MLVEGTREIERALGAGWRLELLVTCPALATPAAQAACEAFAAAALDVRRFSAPAFAKVSLRERPDGVLGVVRSPPLGLDDLAWPEDGLYLVLAGLEKPGNVGALVRSADAVGCRAVFVTGAGTDLGNPNVVRASMGSLFARPVLHVEDERLQSALRRRGVRLVATSPGATKAYWSVPMTGALAIVVGPEHTGLGAAWLTAADEVVTIPMRGAADSLNVATAGALVLFEALRQRHSRQMG